jgi:hypothetical protein
MKQVERKCKTCKHWDIEYAKNKAGRVRKDSVAQCNYPLPILPASCSRNTPVKGWMAESYGKDCLCYSQRIVK